MRSETPPWAETKDSVFVPRVCSYAQTALLSLSLIWTPAKPLSGASPMGAWLLLWLSQSAETHSVKEKPRRCHTCACSLGRQASSVQVPLYPDFLLPFPPIPAPLHAIF